MEEDIKTLERLKKGLMSFVEGAVEESLSNTMKQVLEVRRKQVKAIENLINKYKEQEKIIEIMAKDIAEITGSCPFDLHNYQVEDCDNICQMLADNG